MRGGWARRRRPAAQAAQLRLCSGEAHHLAARRERWRSARALLHWRHRHNRGIDAASSWTPLRRMADASRGASAEDGVPRSPAGGSGRRRRPERRVESDEGEELGAGTGIAAAALLGAGLFVLRRVLPFGKGRGGARPRAGGPPVPHFRASDLPPSSPAVVAAWNTRAVADFLRHCELGQHAKAFSAAGVDGQLLITLSAADMAELGVTSRVQRVRPSRTHARGARGRTPRSSAARRRRRQRHDAAPRAKKATGAAAAREAANHAPQPAAARRGG